MTLYKWCTNSGPGRFGTPEVTQTDRLGFSLCAVPLDIVGPCISEWHGVRTTVGRMKVQCIPDWRESEGLVSKRIELSQYSN